MSVDVFQRNTKQTVKHHRYHLQPQIFPHMYLGAENQVGQLAESQENDEEHESESDHVLGTASKGARQLVHRLVEGNVLENLKGRKEGRKKMVMKNRRRKKKKIKLMLTMMKYARSK